MASPGKRIIILWILTIVITLSSLIYQRLTGPTYPIRGSADIAGETVKYELLRSHETTGDAAMVLHVPNKQVTGKLQWRRYRSKDTLSTVELPREGDNLILSIPKQPSAGKVIYDVSLIDGDGNEYKLNEEPVIIRFKGAVPFSILFPHILCMFFSMFLAARAGLEAYVKGNNAYKFTVWTASLFFIGGIILGPIVQKFAFDAFWTGWPFGHDLTDNKTAVAMLFWVIAVWRARDNAKGRVWIIIAAAIQLLVYLIPHSALGSEIDYTKMQ